MWGSIVSMYSKISTLSYIQRVPILYKIVINEGQVFLDSRA